MSAAEEFIRLILNFYSGIISFRNVYICVDLCVLRSYFATILQLSSGTYAV